MTDIELLFREYRRDDAIKYEEFLSAGWSSNEYLEYLGKCEIIRSSLVLLRGYGRLTRPLKKDTSKTYEQLKIIVNRSFKGLLFWLQPYFSSDITHYKFNLDFFPMVYLFSYSRNYTDIYVSSDQFRGDFENALSIRLLNNNPNLNWHYDISSVSDEDIEHEIKELRRRIDYNELPQDPNYNSYSDLQRWAGQMDEYDYINTKEYDLEALEEELENRKRIFDASSEILYIYSGTTQCLHEHSSDVISITAIIKCIENAEIKMNINYCPHCNLYFLRQSEYDYYREIYGVLPIRMKYVGSNVSIGDFNERSEFSFLSLAGYSVSQKAGLSETERQNILINLLYHNTSKYEIINHLTMLVETNGNSSRMHNARERWISDLRFIRDYRIDEQRKKEMCSIQFGSPKKK